MPETLGAQWIPRNTHGVTEVLQRQEFFFPINAGMPVK